MASDNQPDNTKPLSPETQKVKRYSTTAALALELPFTIVGALVVGGAVGYFLDRVLHTQWIFTVALGVLGFAGGIREALRRLP